GPGALVRDNGRGGEQRVAERVIAVVVRVKEGANRRRGDVPDGGEAGRGAPLGGARVDAEHALRPDDETGVVDPPGPVRLDVGVDAVGDLDRPRSSGRRNLVRV